MDNHYRPSLTLLGSDQVERVHQATLRLLQRTGVEIQDEEVLAMLRRSGAEVDGGESRAYLPPELVERCLNEAPDSFVLQARNSKCDCSLEPNGGIFFRNVGGPDHIVDMLSGEYRDMNVDDLRQWTILVDGLEHIDYCMGCYPAELPLANRDVHIIGQMFRYTEKHLHIQPYSAKNIERMVKISRAVSDGLDLPARGSLFSVFISSKTPLCYPKNELEMLLAAGRHGVPVMLNSTPLAGGNAPVTIAGELVLLNAEILAGLTIAQSASPGAPIVYAPRALNLDMRSTIAASAYVENSLANSAATQIARTKYNLPTDMFGPMTDAHIPADQSIMEKTYTAFLPALAGSTIIAGAGMLDSVGTVSPVQLVMDDELMGMVKRTVRGIDLDDETLALDVIDEVHSRHNFLDTKHTLKYYLREYFMPELCVRTGREAWVASGRRDMVSLAREKAQRILAEHRIPELPDEVVRQINSIVDESDRESR